MRAPTAASSRWSATAHVKSATLVERRAAVANWVRHTLTVLLIVLLFAQPASGKQASFQDRLLLSQAVANYVNDPDFKGYKYFNGTRAVQIGAAVIEGIGALADWRSVDGKHHGQVAFLHRCDSWNVLRVSNNAPLRAEQIATDGGLTRSIARVLVAGLSALESQHVAYLGPQRAQVSC